MLTFPINKPLWTSSYVLFTPGMATLFLVLLIWIIDQKGWKKWTYIFHVFGINPLVSYVLSVLFIKLLIYTLTWEGDNAYSMIYTSIFQPIFGNMNGSLALALCYTMFIWLFAWILYRKKIVVKL